MTLLAPARTPVRSADRPRMPYAAGMATAASRFPAPSTGMDAILAPLRASDLFRSLDDAAASRLARHLVRRRYRADEVIFHQGDPGDRLHVIESGRVRIGMEAEDGREGILTILGAGKVFGELVLLDGSARSATAIAMEPTVTVTLDRETFGWLVEQDAEIRDAVLAGVARWLRRVTDQVTELHFLDLRGRVASTLVRMARESATGHGPVELPALTQAEVASLVAGTRQRVNAALGELVREGLIAYDGRRITVLDVARLEDRVGW